MSEEGSEPFVVNKRELARVFDVSEPTIGRWLEAGCPVLEGGSNGVAYKFDVDQVRAWRRGEEDKAAAERASRQARIDEHQQTLFGQTQLSRREGLSPSETREWLQAEYYAQKLSAERRELIPREEVQRDYAATLGVIRQRLLGLAPAAARAASLTPEQQHAIDRVVRETLTALHAQIADAQLRPEPLPEAA